ncbi:MAG: tetratricopeptide repeat protein [Candidatus Nitrosopolaris sp.]
MINKHGEFRAMGGQRTRSDNYVLLGILLYHLGKYDDAERIFSKAIKYFIDFSIAGLCAN